MRQSVRRQFLPLLLVVTITAWTAGGCTTTPVVPTTTTTTAIASTTTETDSGTLNMNGGVTFNFATAAAGTATVALTILGPGSTVLVGLGMGTWNGTACSLVQGQGVFDDAAGQGASVTGSVSGVGTLCVRIYDVGNVTDPLPFTLNITHP